MDYQKLIGSLLAEAKKGVQYKRLNLLLKIFAIVCMIPFYVFAFFGVVGYYVALFFYNALLSPCSYLESWEKERTKDMHPAPKAVVLFCTTSFIFFLRILIAFFSFFFYFQWFNLQITFYISTFGGIKFQPWINTATFEEETTWKLSPEEKTAKNFFIPTLIFEFAPIVFWIFISIFKAIAKNGKALKFWFGLIDTCGILAYICLIGYLVCTCIEMPCLFKKTPITSTEEVTD